MFREAKGCMAGQTGAAKKGGQARGLAWGGKGRVP